MDFYCAKANLVIELDGSQHYQDDEIQNDLKRREFLREYGLNIIRISNLDINRNFKSVCDYIDDFVKKALTE